MKAECFVSTVANNCIDCPVIDFLNERHHVDLIITDVIVGKIVSYLKRRNRYKDCVVTCLEKYSSKDQSIMARI